MRLCTSNPLYPLSWGIGNIVVRDEIISFDVNGSRYKGAVVIERGIGSLKVFAGDSEISFINAKDAFYWLDQYIE